MKSGLDTYVATDSRKICWLVPPGHSIYTSDKHINGTERVAEAARILGKYDQVINVQGDMPDITPEIIDRIKTIIPMTGVATAWTEPKDDTGSKIIHNNVFAHWFGRSLGTGHHHLGVYGYTVDKLEKYLTWKPSEHEEHENLEQLRWFQYNTRIAVTRVDFNGIEINTPEDMEKWNESR